MTTKTHIPLDQLLNGTDDIILVKDAEGRHLYANQAGADFLGIPTEKILGRTDEELFPGDRGQTIMELDRRVMRADARTEGIESVVVPAGEFFFHTTKWPWKEDGKTLGVLAIVRNITEAHNTEQELIDSEELHRTTLANISDTVLITDDHGAFTWICPNIEVIFGYSPKEVDKLGSIDALMASLQFDQDILDAEGELENVEVRIQDRDGTTHDLLINIKKVSIGEGTTLYSCRDITERLEAEAEAEVGRGRLQAILDNSPATIFMKDGAGRYQVSSSMLEKLTGKSTDELLGKTDDEIFPPEVARSIQSNDRKVVEGGVPLTIEENVQVVDGIRTFLSTKFPVFDNAGRSQGLGGISVDITEVKKAQQALAKSEKQYREFIEETEDLITQVDSTGTLTFVNSQAEKFFGLPSSKCIGLSAFDFIHPDDRDETQRQFNEYIRSKAVTGQFVNRQQSRDGTVHHVSWNSHFFYDDSDALTQINSIARDVSDLIEAQEAARKSEQLFSGAFSHAPIGMALVGPDGSWLKVNRSLCDIVGYSENELLGKTFQDITHPDDLETDLEFVRQMLADEISSYQMEKRYLHRSGAIIWIQLSVSLVTSDTGHPLHFISQIRDITESKNTQMELTESENRYRAVFESGADVFQVFDLQGNIIDVNQKACETYGYTREEMLKLSGKDLVAPEYHHLFKAFSGTKAGEWFKTESVDVKKDGTRFNIQIHGTKLAMAGQERLLAIVRDTTEEVANKQALLESETRFRNLAEATSDWVWEVDQNAVYTYCSPQVTNLLGHQPEDVIGKTPFDLMSPDEAQRVAEIFGPIAQAQEPIKGVENVNLHADGSRVVMETSGVPIFGDNGKFKGYRGIDRDITERKRVVLELRKEKELGDALTAIEMMLSSTLELEKKLPEILTEVVQSLGATGACLDLHTKDTWAMSHCDEGSTLAELSSDVRIEANRRRVVEQAGVIASKGEGYLGIPVVQQDKTIGVISIVWAESSKPDSAELDFSRKLGFLLSLAIENSRLYAAERDIANILQSSLLSAPARLDGVEFGHLYHSATESATVGGDFYDLFDLGKGRIGVVLGDVSGKGVGASTLTSMVKHTLRAHAFDGERPEVIVGKTSEAVLRGSDPASFVTLFFGILDSRGGILEYCCAGHPAPAYLSTDKAEILKLTISPAIGMFPGVDFRHGTLTLRPRDRLVLYTDGVTEARHDHGDMYGDDRLLACLDVSTRVGTHDLPKVIFDDVLKHAGGVLQDDVAVLTLSLSRE